MNKKEVIEQIKKNDKNGLDVDMYILIKTLYQSIQDYKDIIILIDAFDEYTEDFESEVEHWSYNEVAEYVIAYKQSDLELGWFDDTEKQEIKSDIERIKKGGRK